VSKDEDSSKRTSILSKDSATYLNQKISEDPNFLFTLEPMAITLITEKTLTKLDFRIKERMFLENKFLLGINPTLFEKLFSSYFKEYKHIYRRTEGLESFTFPYENLTKQQLTILAKKN
jgi:hypothetical protein